MVTLNLGAGQVAKPDEISSDLSAYSNALFTLDTLTFLRGVRTNAVDRIVSIHHLEHLRDKPEFLAVMAEILRVCKVGAELYFELPYWSQGVNNANPYHNILFNEHSFRFFCEDEASGVIESEAMLQTYRFGLVGSANENTFDKYLRIESIQYGYFPEYADLPEPEKVKARLHQLNVVRDFAITMRVVPKVG